MPDGNEPRLDRFARTFAGGLSRRDALRKIGVAMVGGAGATVALTEPASAAGPVKCAKGQTTCCNATCGTVCVNAATDVFHCGGCGIVCPTPKNGSAVCANSTCGVACNTGYSACGGACVDTTSDPNNCGTCGTVCTSGTCTGGKCGSPIGSSCNSDNGCISGHCAGGICCATACTATGVCGPTGACMNDGTACAYATTTTQCGVQTCTGSTQTNAAYCNGNGTCAAATTTDCSPYGCGPTACKTSCANDTDCVAGAICSNSHCVAAV